jgi:hypothetical protein
MGRQIERTGVNDETAGDRDHGRDHERGDTDADPGTSQRHTNAAWPAVAVMAKAVQGVS